MRLKSVEQQSYTNFLHTELLADLLFNLLFYRHVWFYRNRKRDEAKRCTIFAWRTHCNQSDVADGILKKVIGPFNPFCDGDKDPLAEQTDQCANYSKPLDDEGCPLPSKQPNSMTKRKRHGVLPYLVYLTPFVTLNLHLDNLITISPCPFLPPDKKKLWPIYKSRKSRAFEASEPISPPLETKVQ